jgi:hypothetical protein
LGDNAWKAIVRLQQELKNIVLLAEENELTFNVFIQPTLEQRSALDHICRAKAAELGITKVENGDYSQKQYDKAVGHLYRAFFDVADWFEVVLREKILNLMKPYDAEVIQDVVPDYYSSIRPRIEAFALGVAKIRGQKDIGQSTNNVITLVDEYSAKINELVDLCEKLLPKVPALNDRQKKQHKSKLRGAVWGVALVLIGAVLAALTTYFVIPRSQASTKTPPVVVEQPVAPPTK